MPKPTVPADGAPMPAVDQKTRRAALFLLASAVACPLAGGATPDPVRVAIEAHRAAHAAFTASVNAVDSVAAEQEGRDISPAQFDAHDALDQAERDALDAFLTTIPTTRGGVRAMLTYTVEIAANGLPDDGAARLGAALLRSPALAA